MSDLVVFDLLLLITELSMFKMAVPVTCIEDTRLCELFYDRPVVS